MHTKRQLRNALTELSDSDFQNLIDDLDEEAQEVVASHDGRTEQALALAKHYDAAERSLSTLADLIREIAPGVL